MEVHKPAPVYYCTYVTSTAFAKLFTVDRRYSFARKKFHPSFRCSNAYGSVCHSSLHLEVFKPAPVHFCTDFTSTASATVSTYGSAGLTPAKHSPPSSAH
ncbi:hypothetical protein RF11_06988 [Thelohanellus kitauei]|uniref:Uncharacterized protein n=1 Tax=Thelohanellus kitauei TaxID=669202 RepID=A0A0C2N9S2_THEKT|nr:hypothetical protein RF11_06988 [Thelohanellus kitauei]